jgi:hypothetical protein
LVYDEYCSLLLAAAVAHDEQYKPKKSKRQIFYHHVQDEDNDDIDDQEPYNIDYPASFIQAYATTIAKCLRHSLLPLRLGCLLKSGIF